MILRCRVSHFFFSSTAASSEHERLGVHHQTRGLVLLWTATAGLDPAAVHRRARPHVARQTRGTGPAPVYTPVIHQ